MKGIILAGGSGTRLHPATAILSKQLLPVYDKPMIYYPLSTLMLAGIREILIISTPRDLPLFQALLGDGSVLGLQLSYVAQDAPRGIAEAFTLGRDFIGNNPVALILGDNIFFGNGLSQKVQAASEAFMQNPDTGGAQLFAYAVKDPSSFGVIEFDASGTPVEIIEKPKNPRSPWAVTGLYFYDRQIMDIAAALKPSARGELEITDVNQIYLQKGQISVEKLGRGYAWLDTGTHESLLQASEFVRIVQDRQGYSIGCIEEIAWRMGFIEKQHLRALADPMGKSSYGDYLRGLL
jgi:glucose-1-phosphate thymidylyltransferase